jgi:hypothetical protein
MKINNRVKKDQLANLTIIAVFLKIRLKSRLIWIKAKIFQIKVK